MRLLPTQILAVMRRMLGFVPWSIVLVAALGCAAPSGGTPTITLVDDHRDTLRLQQYARRIVSLIPAATELLYSIGAGTTLVGRTQWCTEPAAVMSVPIVGRTAMGSSFDVADVARKAPDLVLLDPGRAYDGAAEQLRSLRIPTFRVAVNTLADVDRVAHLIGRITGRASGADSLITALRASLRHIAVPITGVRRKVLIVAWDRPVITAGRGSFLHEVVVLAGGENVFGDRAEASPTVTLEQAAARTPDMLLVVGLPAAAITDDPRWQVLKAVRQRQIWNADQVFGWPGPRTPKAVQHLITALYAR